MEVIYDFKRFSSSTQLALSCFFIGTLLLVAFFLFPENDGIIITGLFFVIFAIFFNGIVLINLLYQWATIPDERENTAVKLLILLSNIPIALLYLYLIINSVKNNSPF